MVLKNILIHYTEYETDIFFLKQKIMCIKSCIFHKIAPEKVISEKKDVP
jgi:hypothetical protein